MHHRRPDNEGVLVGARLAVFAQQWQNLLGECRSSRILWSGILLKWECHQPPLTRTPIHFLTRSKKQDLQKAVDSLLEKGAKESVHRSRSLGFFSRLFLVPKMTGKFRPVIDLSMLNRHLVIPHLQMEIVRAAVCQDEWMVSVDIKDALWKKISNVLYFLYFSSNFFL